jgi:hypothetical protein
LKLDIAIAVIGGLAWGALVGYAYWGIGDEKAIVIGVLYGLGWALLWMVASLIRSAIQRRRAEKE